MKWIFLIGNDDLSINNLKKLNYPGCISTYDVETMQGRFCVDYGDEHVFLDPIENRNDFEELINQVPYINPAIVMMTYTSSDNVRSILQQEDFPNDIYIDNDLGLLAPLKEYVSMGMPMD